MAALLVIVWLICLLISLVFVFHFVGLTALVCMFPEGRRWWMFPVQLSTLAAFAAVVINHPF